MQADLKGILENPFLNLLKEITLYFLSCHDKSAFEEYLFISSNNLEQIGAKHYLILWSPNQHATILSYRCKTSNNSLQKVPF